MKNLLFVVAVLLVASCSNLKTEEMDFIRAEGKNYVDEQGQKYAPRGINLGGWLNPEGYLLRFKNCSSASEIHRAICQMVGEEYADNFWKEYLENYVTKEDIDFIASKGVNSIRLPFHYKLFTDNHFMGSNDPERGFRIIDELIEWCRPHQIRIILDMHDAPGGQTGDNIDDSYGYPWLYESQKHSDQFVEIWTKIAKRYANEPMILGYDLLNEPIASHFPESYDKLHPLLGSLYERVIEAMRVYDPNHIMFIAGAQWNTNFEIFKDCNFGDNYAYSFHFYWRPTTQDEIKPFLAYRDELNIPLHVGEAGECTNEWAADCRALFDKNEIAWHFWIYKKMYRTPTSTMKVNAASFTKVAEPEGWEATIMPFVESPRDSYAAIRAARPDQDTARAILNSYLFNLKFSNCSISEGYIDALAF